MFVTFHLPAVHNLFCRSLPVLTGSDRRRLNRWSSAGDLPVTRDDYTCSWRLLSSLLFIYFILTLEPWSKHHNAHGGRAREGNESVTSSWKGGAYRQLFTGTREVISATLQHRERLWVDVGGEWGLYKVVSQRHDERLLNRLIIFNSYFIIFNGLILYLMDLLYYVS